MKNNRLLATVLGLSLAISAVLPVSAATGSDRLMPRQHQTNILNNDFGSYYYYDYDYGDYDYNDDEYDDYDDYDYDYGYDDSDYDYDYDDSDYDYSDYDYGDYDSDDYDYGNDDDSSWDDYDESGSEPAAKEVSVTKRTKKQIKNYLKKHNVNATGKTTYSQKPSAKSPYKAGKLSSATLKSAINTLNAMRYIAGLDANVKLDDDFTKMAQAAALVNAANNQLSHYPGKPKGMKDSLYKLGQSGAGSCNLGMGYGSLNSAIVNGWMSDGDSSNIDRLGHRRWVLNPSMGKTGFGLVGSYSAMYCFDTSGKGGQTNVYWPAQTMPVKFFANNDPWSVSTGKSVTKSKVKVVLTRKPDNKKWTFSSKNKKSGYFNVNNDGYGMSGCIIFRPKNIKYKSGNKFHVKITGVSFGTIEYDVSFF